jgi:hypothetical protein
MNFLAPWFFAGAAAIALPIIFHLVRQSIRKKKLFSSLMFLKPTPPKIKRRNRLEHILLLLLRCALLLLLAAAFTRPFFKQPAGAQSVGQQNHITVVLIDTSASMRRGTLWNEATELATKVFDELKNSHEVALIAFDRQNRTMISFEEWARTEPSQRATMWKERLSVIEPTYGGTTLGNALINAAELLEDARSRNEATVESITGRLILISDLQEGAHLDGLAGFNWPSRVTVEMRSPEYRSKSNAGLHPVASDPNAVLTSTQTNTSRVFISNASDSTKELFSVSWANESGRSLHEPEQIYLPPGQSRVTRLPSLTNGATAQRIQLTGDDESFDNTIYVVPDEPQQVRILSLSDGEPTDPKSLSFFLKNVFQSTTRQTMAFTNIAEPAVVSSNDSIDLLIATDKPAAARLVQTQLDAGKSVLFVLDREGTADLLKSVLQLPNLAVQEGQQRNYALLGKIKFEHPLFAPFMDSRFSDFTGIHFWKYRKLDPDKLPDARVLAEFDNGDPALIEIPRGKASIFVLTTSWLPQDSRLALSSKFVPLIYSFLEMNRPPQTDGQSLTVGDTLASAGVDGQSSLVKPDGKTLVDATRATAFETPGIYVLKPADRAEFLVAVNLDSAESRTAPMQDEALIRLGVPITELGDSATAAQIAREIQQKDSETEAQQKNWRWLLAAAVGIFLLESFLAGRAGSRLSEEAPAT